MRSITYRGPLGSVALADGRILVRGVPREVEDEVAYLLTTSRPDEFEVPEEKHDTRRRVSAEEGE